MAAANKTQAAIQGRGQDMLARLEQHVNTMTDNFVFVVKAARINEDDDKPEGDNKVPGEIPEVLAEKIILGGKGLLELIAELKRKAIVSDYPAINSMRAERDRAFEKEVSTTESVLHDIKHEVTDCLHQLEHSYYSSKHKPPVSLDKYEDKELKPLYDLALDLSNL